MDYKRGIIYFGGDFATANGVTVNGIARYTLSTGTFTAMGGTPGVGGAGFPYVEDVYVDQATGDVYIGGDFDTAGGSTVNNMARWDYTNQTWDNIGGDHAGVNNPVHAITGDKQGNIYFGGEFTESVPGLVYPDPITLNRVARLRPGQNALEPLGDGIADGIVWFVYWDNTLNKLLLSGSFSVIGARAVDRAVYWNGTTYEKLPLDFPGTATVTSFARHANGDYYIGFDTTGTMIIPSALNTIINSGTDESKPIFVFDSSADVIGTEYAQLTTLGNRTTGAQINFNDLFILAGSTIYIDIEAGRVYRRTGQTLQDITPGVFRRDSDVSAFALTPGVNEILVSAPDVNGTPSIDAYMLWRNKHWSLSGTAA